MSDKFEPLAKAFVGKEDRALAYRRVALKVGVNTTMALVIASGDKIDWDKVSAMKVLSKDTMAS